MYICLLKMKLYTKRQLLGNVLLVLYMTILLAGALHVHERVGQDFVCQDCINHIYHNGHIAEASSSSGECLLCDFLSVTYIATCAILVALVAVIVVCTIKTSINKAHSCQRGVLSLRAPPCL